MLELHIGRLRFCFGFSFFLLLAVVCRWQAGSMLLLSFLTILLHEIGHFLAMLLTKTAIKSINFTAFGVHIVRSAVQFVPPLRLVVVYLAGPAVNLLLALLFLGRSREGMAGYFGAVNLLLGSLHLLPAGSLDGALCPAGGTEFSSARELDQAGGWAHFPGCAAGPGSGDGRAG